jgi:hypothetical protein
LANGKIIKSKIGMEYFEDIKESTLELVTDIKNGKIPTDGKHSRMLNAIVLGLVGVICFIYPSLFRVIFAGYINDDNVARITSEFLRLFGVALLGLAAVNLLSKNWGEKEKSGISQIMFGVTLSLLLCKLLFMYLGGSLMYLLTVVPMGVLVFLNGKGAKLF